MSRWVATVMMMALLNLGAHSGVAVAQTPAPAILLPFWDDSEEGSNMKVDHSAWQAVLDVYLDDQSSGGINRFNYGAVNQRDQRKLDAYVDYLQSLEPRQLNKLEQKAYWINLYNAATVLLILNEGRNADRITQFRSGLFTSGPWQRKRLNVVQQDISLDDIKHGILRPIWSDNRVHYALSCASLSCPNLLKTAYTGANIEALLEFAAAQYINHQRAVRITNKRLILSEIYQWYEADFGTNNAELMAHLTQYAEPELAEKLKLPLPISYAFNWDMNKP